MSSSSSSSSWAAYGPPAPSQASGHAMPRSASGGDRPKKPQSRQLLSCTKCRERKVKCDRTKPCSACCARGHPKECEFIVGEGNDYSPIQQSYEIRKLRAENQRLKERLVAAKLSHSGDEDDEGDAAAATGSSKTTRASVARQRRFKTGDRVDNLYFGTPGLANMVHDFANLQVGNHSLTHPIPMPRPLDMYTSEGSLYPFPVFSEWTGTEASANLVHTLPDREEIVGILASFQRRAQACSFPHTPDEVTRQEVERFLADKERNGQLYPDMLALIFITLATGVQMGEWDRSGGRWVRDGMAEATQRADVYLAASMQALRMASFMNQPTLLAVQTLVMIGPYLTNTGRFLDAWTLFGTTIRMAHSIGLHRHPRHLNPAPPLRECMLRQTLWWWILHMDQQYSVTLGRPLGISGIGDCPPPEPLTTDPTILRLGEFVDHFTILARQILSSDGLMSVAKIDDFTDKFVGLWDTMPEALQFNESWLQPDQALPDWPLEVMSATLFAKVQSFLILLNRPRIERTQHNTQGDASPPAGLMAPPRPQHPRASIHPSAYLGEPPTHRAPLRGRDLVIQSSCQILSTFIFFHRRQPAVLVCWSMGQQAFNACMILILEEWETGNEHNQWLVNEAYGIFVELGRDGVHKLAALAVRRISDGLLQLGNRKAERTAAITQGPDAPPPLALAIDTSSMMDWSSDSVMGNTGMYLLEDPGLQSSAPQAFQPLAWNMAGSAHPSNPSDPPTPGVPSPVVPVSQVTAAPFPVMTPPFLSTTIPVTNSPYALGLQPRMPNLHHPRRPASHVSRHAPAPAPAPAQPPAPPPSEHEYLHQPPGPGVPPAFTPVNPALFRQQQQQQQGPPQHGPGVPPPPPSPQVQRSTSQQQLETLAQLRAPRRTHSSHHHHPGHGSHPHGGSPSGAGGGPRGVQKVERGGAAGGRSVQRRK